VHGTLRSQVRAHDHRSMIWILRYLMHLLAKHQKCVCGKVDSAELSQVCKIVLANCCMVWMRETYMMRMADY
jgi:hypothetical protein